MDNLKEGIQEYDALEKYSDVIRSSFREFGYGIGPPEFDSANTGETYYNFVYTITIPWHEKY